MHAQVSANRCDRVEPDGVPAARCALGAIKLQYRSHKERIVRIVGHLFAERGDLTAADVERIIRSHVRSELLQDPTMTADHLRVALVELGLLTRSNDGVTYHFNPDGFLSSHNIRGLFGA